ncbi:DUF1796 family putative cysteine peptidase [Methylobacterium sp. Leaf88]|uniref:DUF1796 family putative cysteine peptidase n=1 Tax=Methylobacterium sp. Leaf88 TaxID=1736244 RepID=UPI0009E8451F|nr:DUF1796 family putative cysteine peptidase [Methylobacterium sp. Leaf88]
MQEIRKFSEYVSLGNNCEVAFQIRRVLGRDSSSFFSWNVTPLGSLESLLRSKFSGILSRENLSIHGSGALINDSSHHYKFHSPFADAFMGDSNFEVQYEELKKKFDYLTLKFLRKRTEIENVAYFYKCDEHSTKIDFQIAVVKIRDLIAEIQGNNSFKLVFIQDEAFREEDWGLDNIANRYLKRLAPWADATDGHVQSWDRIFREFPSESEMHLSGY